MSKYYEPRKIQLWNTKYFVEEEDEKQKKKKRRLCSRSQKIQ